MNTRPVRLALALALVACGLLLAPAAGAATDAGTTRAAGDGVLDILVLGDSYSAGNGATDEQGAVQSYGPDGCRRSTVNWGEKYAATLRAGGQPVRLVNHACSGGVTADFSSPRALDTASKTETTPAGVTTPAQADASLAQADPCNTRQFPDEEFWTYHATDVNPVLVSYDCTRNLRPQADFVTPDVDLVLFTIGGNDVGFSSIVQNCFVPLLRTSSGCQGKVDAARALLPQVQQRVLADVAALRAHGLRDDAKLVQLGYPWLQVDNGFTLPDPPGYDAGTQVRSLVTQGDAAIAAVVPAANAGHPGQLTFVTGVPEKFSGHEPDATTPTGNDARWINQVGDGDAIEVWYHPNRLGQTAYAELLATHGTFGAPTGPAGQTAQPTAPARAVTARVRAHRVDGGRVRVRVRLSDGSRAHGRVMIRDGRRRVAAAKVRGRDHGRVVLTLRPRGTTTRLQVVYRDRVAPTVRVRVR